MISVTKGLAGIYVLGFLECLFFWIYLLDQDTSGSEAGLVFVFAQLFLVYRSTYSRLLLLYVALGYEIAVKEIDRHKWRIRAVFAAYALALMVDVYAEELLHTEKISGVWHIVMKTPDDILNVLIFFWIGASFVDTLKYLRATKREYKRSIIF